MAEPQGPRRPSAPPPAVGTLLGSWTLTRAEELAGLRRATTEALRLRSSPWNGSAGDGLRADQLLLLILSELATNALKYGTQPITVSVHDQGDCWLVDVRDANWRTPPGHRPRDDGRAGGHGLRILDTATTAWGWYPGLDDGVKHVWAAVPRAGNGYSGSSPG
jgi:serine/threonine-protein kinase RsbW